MIDDGDDDIRKYYNIGNLYLYGQQGPLALRRFYKLGRGPTWQSILYVLITLVIEDSPHHQT